MAGVDFLVLVLGLEERVLVDCVVVAGDLVVVVVVVLFSRSVLVVRFCTVCRV